MAWNPRDRWFPYPAAEAASSTWQFRCMIPSAKNENADGGSAKEDEIDRHYVVQNLIVTAGARDDHRQDSLQGDGYDRHLRLGMKLSNPLEKQLVLRHRKVDSRSGEHSLTQKSQGRNSDSGRNRARSRLAQGDAHHI